MTWINTVSGKRLSLVTPLVSDVTINDIAHSLSRINRFNGHIRPEHYSVAEHSVRCAIAAERLALPATAQMACLLHDAHEYAVGDISTPLKWHLQDSGQRDALAGCSVRLDAVIWHKLTGQSVITMRAWRDEVHHIDLWMLGYEADRLMHKRDDWDVKIPRDVVLEQWRQPALGWQPIRAKQYFLARYRCIRTRMRAAAMVAATNTATAA